MGDLSEEKINYLAELLMTNKIPLAGQKKALTILAHTGSIPAYRKIEAYIENAEAGMKQWAQLALKECRMLIENDLTDKPM